MYPCMRCHQVFLRKKSLVQQHRRMKCKAVQTKPGLKCYVCNTHFETEEMRDAHVKNEHPGVTFIELESVSSYHYICTVIFTESLLRLEIADKKVSSNLGLGIGTIKELTDIVLASIRILINS